MPSLPFLVPSSLGVLGVNLKVQNLSSLEVKIHYQNRNKKRRWKIRKLKKRRSGRREEPKPKAACFARSLRLTHSRKLCRTHCRSPTPALSPVDGVRLFVGLPLDTVSHECNSVNHARAIAVGPKALKLLGVEGVELPVWWGIVEKEAMGVYDWSGYLAIVEMI